MTAQDIVRAIWRNRQGDAMLTELEIVDEEVRAAHKAHDAAHSEWIRGRREGEMPKLDCGESLCRRIDVLLIDGRQRTAIEIKVDRGDWLRETEAKRRAWRAVTHRFVYACPEGLIRPEEVPDGIGLWYVRPSRYSDTRLEIDIAKRAKLKKAADPLPEKVFVNICHRATMDLKRKLFFGGAT